MVLQNMDLLASLRREPNPNIPDMRAGDTVRVHALIVEGQKERVQVFQGVVMRIRNGGTNANFTVRRIAANGIGVERTYKLSSPRVEKVEVLRRAKVRRAALYYLRQTRGKASRLREDRSGLEQSKAAAVAAAKAETAPVAAPAQEQDAQQ